LFPRDTGLLVGKVLQGETRTLARVLSMVENGDPLSESIMHDIYDPARRSLTVGVTGPPGAGKSTLTCRLIGYWRGSGRKVGVIAVDPSSPFSGGALLGDRVRMQEHASDPGVFIRSMGSRGHLGGLAGSTRDALELLAAAGYDPVIVETVGVGQAEVEVASLADITLLVLVPGMGDEVQTMKAGIMEIGDIIVLNKADRQGIDQLESSVMASLELLPEGSHRPPVVRCSSLTGDGIEELTGEMDGLLSGILDRDSLVRRRTTLILESILREKGRHMAARVVEARFGSIERAVDLILDGKTTPYGIGVLLSEEHASKAGD